MQVTGDQTIGGVKTFSSPIAGSITGNAGTVTNGVYTTGDQTIGGQKTFAVNPVVSAGGIDIGAGTAGSKQLILRNSVRNVSLYNNADGIVGVWDVNSGTNRWFSDTSGNFTASGNITAGGQFIGNGAGLTNVPASAIAGALNASGSAPIYACRAWVNFNGTGTVAIRASGNVSSITDNGVGDYTVNFTTAMPDANYAVAGMAHALASSNGTLQLNASSVAPAAGSLRVGVITPANASFDPTHVTIAIFR